MDDPRDRPASTGYQLFMLVLCLYALAALAAQSAVKLAPETRGILDYADYAVCAMFLCDFLISLWQAPDRRRYLLTWGWVDLLSSIPTVDAARWGRAARVLRIFRVLRGLRATKILASLLMRRRAQNTALAGGLLALLLVIFCSIAMLHFEAEPESNIKSAEDAVWWAFATITTVGYGDRYPVTSEGRFVAAILMCAGVALFGTFSGFLAAWFIGPQDPEESGVREELTAIRQELAELRRSLPRAPEGGAS